MINLRIMAQCGVRNSIQSEPTKGIKDVQTHNKELMTDDTPIGRHAILQIRVSTII